MAEKEILFEVTEFSVCDGIVCLIASYYVFHVDYPKSVVANKFLLFVQELLLGIQSSSKRSNTYAAFVNSL